VSSLPCCTGTRRLTSQLYAVVAGKQPPPPLPGTHWVGGWVKSETKRKILPRFSSPVHLLTRYKLILSSDGCQHSDLWVSYCNGFDQRVARQQLYKHD
jgi:hypothetical protein